MERLPLRDDVAADALEFRPGGLDPADHVELVDGVALAAVDDHHVDTRRHELRQPLAVVGARADGGADEEVRGAVLGRLGVVLGLDEVAATDEGHELALGVDHGQLALLRLAQDLVRRREGHAVRRRDELREGRHDVADLGGPRVLHEVHVPVRHNAHELRPHIAVQRDGDPAEAALLLDRLHRRHRGVGREAHGVGDEPVAVLLDLAHLRDLVLHGHVVVHDAQPALQRHHDGHAALRHRVHGRADERHAQGYLLGEARGQLHLLHAEVDVSRQENDVVVCEPHAGKRLASEDLARRVAVGCHQRLVCRLLFAAHAQQRHARGRAVLRQDRLRPRRPALVLQLGKSEF